MTRYTLAFSADEAWSHLRNRSFGRLAVSLDGQPDIFPVNFLASDSAILIRTEEGTKLELIDANSRVAFEADDVTAERAWSVVVKGTAARLDEAALATARRAPLWTWAPEPKDVFIRIHPTEITGLIFNRD